LEKTKKASVVPGSIRLWHSRRARAGLSEVIIVNLGDIQGLPASIDDEELPSPFGMGVLHPVCVEMEIHKVSRREQSTLPITLPPPLESLRIALTERRE
jgi:hypothetical protein